MNSKVAALLVTIVASLGTDDAFAAPIIIGPGLSPGIPSSDGFNSGTRTNVDVQFEATLPAGTYKATLFDLQIVANGTVQPFLAVVAPGATGTGAGTDSFTLVALGDPSTYQISDYGTTAHVAFGGSNTFTLTSPTTVYAGETNPSGSPGPVVGFVFPSGSIDDHNNPAFAGLAVGSTTGTFNNAGLGRNYTFDIQLEAIPEPTSLVLFGLGALGLVWTARRRRKS